MRTLRPMAELDMDPSCLGPELMLFTTHHIHSHVKTEFWLLEQTALGLVWLCHSLTEWPSADGFTSGHLSIFIYKIGFVLPLSWSGKKSTAVETQACKAGSSKWQILWWHCCHDRHPVVQGQRYTLGSRVEFMHRVLFSCLHTCNRLL